MDISKRPSIKYNRKITGYSAILLPFNEDGSIDWAGFTNHVKRTSDAGLTPTINMDTGYGNLITYEIREEALKRSREVLGKGSVASGVFVGDKPGASFNYEEYARGIEQILRFAGEPVIFQSYGLTEQHSSGIVDSYKKIGSLTDKFIAFELGNMFAPFGSIYDIETYTELVKIPQCIGAKHSSLSRTLEWERLHVRDEIRPEFKVFTGNDLAIDMVMYGSDYLLGLSTFCPDYFAKRDAMWEKGDVDFYELNDLLQYLGFLAFRPTVPAYKHNAAQFLKLRDWIATNKTHPQSPERPESDIPILKDILSRLEEQF
ncbi:MAG: dihydrodipicolinate synthase family protein [Lentisphaeraceae bacterium]|nr:dihydrodipicolinate synthase family protein [Lentisphaeraceae bacterium]